MPSYDPVIKNGASGAIFYASLLDTAIPNSLKITPTIAAGDFKISIDGGAFANLATLPVVTPAGSSAVKFVLSQAETNGDNLMIQCVDQTAVKEWCDASILIQTAASNFSSWLDEANAIETGLTVRQALRLMAATLAGKVSGAGTSVNVFRNAVADSKPRVTSTVDGPGNRTAITYDVT